MTDHDRFDRPLARAARPPGGDVTAACLDAGTLAAWTDGSLRPAERSAAEAPVADCGRCLERRAVVLARSVAQGMTAEIASAIRLPVLALTFLAGVALALLIVRARRPAY